jgi:type II secretory pathway pseudopilin PulG
MNRTALSLLELLVAIAILAVHIALLVPAIQKVRDFSLLLMSKNNVKQVSQAVFLYADGRDGSLPSSDGSIMRGELNVHQAAVSVLRAINTGPGFDLVFPFEPLFISPVDPSYREERDEHGKVTVTPTSYAANGQLFRASTRYPSGILDGVSNTLLFTERYYDCFFRYGDYGYGVPFAWGPELLNGWDSEQVRPLLGPGQLSRPSRPGATFQVRPRVYVRPEDPKQLVDLLIHNRPPDRCDPAVPQTPHAGG